MSVEMVMEEIRKDKSFYRYGNGGVTISGGEPLLQWKFTKELLKACKKEGIHTAIETSLYADQEVIKELLPYLDRIFADFKLATEKEHMHYTGVSNQKIKDNIRYLLETSNREKVIIRTPMIPEMTATKDNIKGIAKYLNGIYQYVSYEILNYNPLAEAKYHLVDREYCFEENEKAEKITEEILEENPDLKAIYMTSHGESGVCMALKKKGMAGKIKMIANDFMGKLQSHERRLYSFFDWTGRFDSGLRTGYDFISSAVSCRRTGKRINLYRNLYPK